MGRDWKNDSGRGSPVKYKVSRTPSRSWGNGRGGSRPVRYSSGKPPETPKPNDPRYPSQNTGNKTRSYANRGVLQQAPTILEPLKPVTGGLKLGDPRYPSLQNPKQVNSWNKYNPAGKYSRYPSINDLPPADNLNKAKPITKPAKSSDLYSGMGDVHLLEYYQNLFDTEEDDIEGGGGDDDGGWGWGGGGWGGGGWGGGSYRNPINWYFSLLNWRI